MCCAALNGSALVIIIITFVIIVRAPSNHHRTKKLHLYYWRTNFMEQNHLIVRMYNARVYCTGRSGTQFEQHYERSALVYAVHHWATCMKVCSHCVFPHNSFTSRLFLRSILFSRRLCSHDCDIISAAAIFRFLFFVLILHICQRIPHNTHPVRHR